jgi:hypothetical protein
MNTGWRSAEIPPDCFFKLLIDLHDAVVVERQHLNHQNRRNLSLWIDPEVKS